MKPTCSGPQCQRPIRCSGLCTTHYKQKIAGKPITELRERQIQSSDPCAAPGCAGKRSAKGYCRRHYKRVQQGLTLEPVAREVTPCAVDGCERVSKSKGLCNTHYERVRRNGTLETKFVHAPRGSSLAEVLDVHTDKTLGPGRCWLWTGAVETGGRGSVSVPVINKTIRAHRAAYEIAFGPIPDGLEIDHKCRVLRCVNPDHLQAVTHPVNMQNLSGARADSASGVRGVSRHGNRWRVEVTVNQERHAGGSFEDLADAEEAAVALRLKLHTNNLRDRE